MTERHTRPPKHPKRTFIVSTLVSSAQAVSLLFPTQILAQDQGGTQAGMQGRTQADTAEPRQAHPRSSPEIIAIKEAGKQKILNHDTANALKDLDKYCKTDWTDPEGHFWLAYALSESGKPDEALKEYDQAEQKQTRFCMDCPELRVNRGNQLFKLGRMNEAEREYKRALEVDPLLYDARLNLAQLLLLQNRVDEAFTQLRQCSYTKSKDAKFCLLEGIANLKKAQINVAMSWLEKCQITSNQYKATSRSIDPVCVQAQRLLQFLKAPQ
ncbi:MAG TPA: tetratricopeptide repeat protein [Oculatellaceae cyanobacterium]